MSDYIFDNSNWEKGMPKILKAEQIYRAVMQVVSERGFTGATTKQMADASEFVLKMLGCPTNKKVQAVEKIDFADPVIHVKEEQVQVRICLEYSF